MTLSPCCDTQLIGNLFHKVFNENALGQAPRQPSLRIPQGDREYSQGPLLLIGAALPQCCLTRRDVFKTCEQHSSCHVHIPSLSSIPLRRRKVNVPSGRTKDLAKTINPAVDLKFDLSQRLLGVLRQPPSPFSSVLEPLNMSRSCAGTKQRLHRRSGDPVTTSWPNSLGNSWAVTLH